MSRRDSLAASGVLIDEAVSSTASDDGSSSDAEGVSEDEADLLADRAADLEDRRQVALCGEAPRLLLTCKEVLRKRAVGEDLSLPYAAALAHDRGLVDARALGATKSVKGELGAVREVVVEPEG